MLKKLKSFFDNSFSFLTDDDLRLTLRDKLRLVGDVAVWPYNYIRSFFK